VEHQAALLRPDTILLRCQLREPYHPSALEVLPHSFIERNPLSMRTPGARADTRLVNENVGWSDSCSRVPVDPRRVGDCKPTGRIRNSLSYRVKRLSTSKWTIGRFDQATTTAASASGWPVSASTTVPW